GECEGSGGGGVGWEGGEGWGGEAGGLCSGAVGRPGSRFDDAVRLGLDFMVVTEPRVAGTLEGKGSMSWGGAAGTWFWVDPTNDLIFVGMIQRMGDTGGDPFGAISRTLTYQALIHPER